MKKSSLGRRKSSQSGIPVRSSMAASSYQSLFQLPTTPFSSRFLGAPRPDRSLACSSSGLSRASSIGSMNSKKDLRNLQDKDWQLGAEREVYEYLARDQEGCIIISRIQGIKKNISINLFLEIIIFFMSRLGERVDLNKVNYKDELPGILKLLQYKGKVDKSWLSTVNVPHAWPHVLGVFQFFYELVSSIDNIEAVAFPEKLNLSAADEEGTDWDPRSLCNFLKKSYELSVSSHPHKENEQSRLIQEMIQLHYPSHIGDEILKAEEIVKTLEYEVREIEKGVRDTKEDEMSLQKTNEEIQNEIVLRQNLQEAIEKHHQTIATILNEKKSAENKMTMRLEEKAKLQAKVDEQGLSKDGLDKLMNEKSHLEAQLRHLQEYTHEYSKIVGDLDLQNLKMEEEANEIILSYNLLLPNLIGKMSNVESLEIRREFNEENLNKVIEIGSKLKALRDLHSRQTDPSNNQEGTGDQQLLEAEIAQLQCNLDKALKHLEKLKDKKKKIDATRSEKQKVLQDTLRKLDEEMDAKTKSLEELQGCLEEKKKEKEKKEEEFRNDNEELRQLCLKYYNNLNDYKKSWNDYQEALQKKADDELAAAKTELERLMKHREELLEKKSG